MTATKNTKSPKPLNKFTSWMSDFIKMDKTKSTGRKIASSLWALFFGILLAYIYIFLSKGVGKGFFPNPVDILNAVFGSFNKINKETILKYFLVFGFSSIACALSFKAGLFNIGIPGQMMITGIVNFSIFIKLGYKSNTGPVPAHVLLLCLLLSIIVAFIVGLIAGTLKAHLNVHEVISTIMLNWIIVGIAGLLFKQSSASVVWNGLSPQDVKYYFADTLDGVKKGIIKIADSVRETFVIVGIVVLFIMAIAIAFIFNHTSLGYKIRMQGISKTNGKYIGVNDKRITMFVLGISAAIAGIAGFYNYIALSTPVFSEINQPLSVGFEAIAISLLALNSPIGALFSSLFYTTIYSASTNLQLHPLYFEPYDIQVITSIILYMAAISVMFSQFKPIQYFKRLFTLLSDKRYFANLELKRLRDKKIKLIASNTLLIHKIQLNINAKNYETLSKKLEDSQNKFISKIYKLNDAIAKAEIRVKRAEEYFELEKKLYFAIRNESKEIFTLIKNNILQHNSETKKILKQDIKATNNNLDEFKKDIELNKEDNSHKLQIKLLRKELSKLTNEFLSKAMNYKNSDDETINQFESINKEKYRINGLLNTLGLTKKFNIKQQRTALLKNNSFEYKRILDIIIHDRRQMKLFIKEVK
ncbi:ABC transporter permease [Metamycoplasma auris]|uniref:Nucleoside ABC transporter membrane protein n=1 Tax=Metamycoplasma auris TaxID=51363 RepID=A0A2W7GPM9_9BACT|nr:sugar ABC transporter permease [Metamycoplasma auris]PZV99852.1 nucleoside ABC transporter membrane protein [Metamycoplasma auris]